MTDDAVRENYEKYGHPDGKQSYSVGVALPKKLVEGGNSKFVLLIYACIFGLGLPYYIVSISISSSYIYIYCNFSIFN